MPVIVDDFREPEYVEVVQGCRSDKGRVKTAQRVAVVHESLVVERWHWETFLLIAGKDPCNEELEEKVASIDFPRVCIWAGILEETLGSN